MKGLKLFATGFVAMSALALHVNAEEVTNEASLNTCIAKNSNVCKLTENIELENLIDIKYDITLDLNGYSITPKETLKHSGGLVTVIHGGKLTIEDSGENGKISTGNSGDVWGAVQVTKKGETDISKKATLVINDGTLEGYSYAVTGNGNPDRVNTDITINGGKLIGLDAKESLGIYHPQDGVLTVNGGEITGATGIEMRAGKLNVTGGTIRGTHKPVDVNPNGSGATTYGAGIAVAQHTTQKTIEVKVSNGVVEGHTALYESNPQKNSTDAIKNVSIEVTGGTFNAINEGTNAVYSENLTNFITGGEFNTTVDSTYLVAKSTENKTDVYEIETPDGETKYVVVDENKITYAPYEAEEIISAKEFEEKINKIKEEDLKEENEKETFIELKKLINGKTIASIHDITYERFVGENLVMDGFDENLQPNKEVEVTVKIPTNLEKVKEDYTRTYYTIRIHKNDDGIYEVKELKGTDNKDGTVTFKTDKFSTYILTYEDVKATTNPPTGDNMLVYFAAAVMSVIGLALTTLRLLKNKSNNIN